MSSLKLKPHLTEKTINLAKKHGIYTFTGPVSYTKEQIKRLFKDIFGYEVDTVRIVKLPAKERGKYLPIRNYLKPAKKKFYVTFKGKVTIAGFDKVTKK